MSMLIIIIISMLHYKGMCDKLITNEHTGCKALITDWFVEINDKKNKIHPREAHDSTMRRPLLLIKNYGSLITCIFE